MSLVAGLSAVAVLGVAWLRGDQPYWLLTGMELCVVLAGVFGLLFARGRFQQGPAMTLVCVAGVIFAASFLGWLSLYRGAMRVGMTLQGGQAMSMTPFLVFRVGVASVLAALACVEVLGRNPASKRALVRATILGVLLSGIAMGLWLVRPWLRTQTVAPSWIIWTLVALGAVVALGLFCAFAHTCIRAFELGRVGRKPEATPAVKA